MNLQREEADPSETIYFMGNYVPWRRNRIMAIIGRYGGTWFKNKRVLELACGYGFIGVNIAMLGADVTFSDGRQKHLDEISELFPAIPHDRLICANLENEWPFEGHWDLILHQGVLYHLTNWQYSLRKCAEHSEHMALETEVLDSTNPKASKIVREEPRNMHSSIIGQSVRVPPVEIERALLEVGFKHELFMNPVLNTAKHKYTTETKNTGKSGASFRRWWWCWRQ